MDTDRDRDRDRDRDTTYPLRLPLELKKKAQHLAVDQGTSLKQIIIDAVRAYVTKK